jgi:tetratricopeptide (TPR) repeat protein
MITLNSGQFGARALLKTFAMGVALLIGINLSAGIADEKGVSTDDLMRQADSSGRNGRNSDALKLYSLAIERQPKLWVAYGQRALALEKMGRHEEALASLNYWDDHHQDGGSWYYRSVIMERNGKLREALVDVDHACKLIKYDTSVFMERVALRLCLGNYSGAREDAYVVLNCVPESKVASELCSITDALCGRQTDAILNLSRFNYGRAHKGSELHMSSQKTNQSGEASALGADQRVRVFKRLMDNPKILNSEQLAFARVILEIFQQDYDVALRGLDQSKMANQTNKKLLRFYCYLLKNDLGHAGTELHYLEESDPNSDLVMDALDIYFFDKDDRRSSITEMKRLLVINAKNDSVLFELAKVYRDLGKSSEALAYCDRALELRHGNEDLLLLKATLLTSMNREDDALKVLSNVLAKNKKCGAGFMQEAVIYTHQEKWNSAIQSLSSAIDLGYYPIKALSARSACYAVIHQDSLARKDAELVKGLDPREWQARLSFN